MSINENIVGLIVCYRDGTQLRYGVARAVNDALVLVDTNGKPVHVPHACIVTTYPPHFSVFFVETPSGERGQ